MLSDAKRPLLWLGHGIRLAGAVDLIEPFLARFGVPFVTSWQGKDMVRNDHPLFMGHAGVYGHRAANRAVQSADLIIAIGTRLALPMTGYDVSKFAPNAKLMVVDVDEAEAAKIAKFTTAYVCDAGVWMRRFMVEHPPYRARDEWTFQCNAWRVMYPWLESPLHDDTPGYINSYRLMWELNKWLKPDQVIVTDMGTALLCSYPMLKMTGRSRLITSTGLGEMGFGLPASIGASLAMGGKEVICLNCDGGMQMNLQELATIKHHRLPIKIIVFCNGGYQMIKRSQEAMRFGHTASAEDAISFPDWRSLSASYGLHYADIHDWDGFNAVMPQMQNHKGPWLITVQMDPSQKFGPKTVYGESLEVME